MKALTWVVDGVAFQDAWQDTQDVEAVLRSLSEQSDVRLIVLNRGLTKIPHGLDVPFPRYDFEHNCAADSILLQKVCDFFEADIFFSLGWTTPLKTPSIYFDVFEAESRGARADVERRLAVLFARYVVCQTNAAMQAILSSLPSVSSSRCRCLEGLPVGVSGSLLKALGDELHQETARGKWKPFLGEWARLRLIQADVDYH